ncbi:hypothetical protein RvY_09731 [Ramazzottius varieornatus]|uniref:Uncharacterized protein n=1 Tax=Ramazzottius varieornatus TaxID=947166 RepID=A0A1D1VFS3_RAMVA|nr:hypothetical protein RvY_09731 [Ramazzottius varieornatus]
MDFSLPHVPSKDHSRLRGTARDRNAADKLTSRRCYRKEGLQRYSLQLLRSFHKDMSEGNCGYMNRSRQRGKPASRNGLHTGNAYRTACNRIYQ